MARQHGRPSSPSLYSFGVLLAFTAAQLAVIKLRVSRARPAAALPRRGSTCAFAARTIPLPAVVGAVLTFAVWIVALVTHPRRAVRGPRLARARARRLPARAPQPRRGADRARRLGRRAAAARRRSSRAILVPMKLGEIGEEMVATAVKLAQERGAAVDALHVIRVPLELPLDAELAEEEERAAESLARGAGARRGASTSRSIGHTVRARAIGEAIVEAAARARHRPDRARLVAALAAPVALLLADGRLRAPQGAVRGADRRLSPGSSGGGAKAATLRL